MWKFYRLKNRKETVMDEEKKTSLNAKELGEVAGGNEAGGNQNDPNGQRCPRCGSTDTDIDLALMEYFCLNCGYRW